MARTKLSEQEWTTFLELATRLGIDVRGLLSQEQDVRFTTLESAGHRLGRAVAQLTTERLSLAHAELMTDPQPCPTCQTRSPVVHRTRDLETVDGPMELTEPVCHCSTCRRDFFPSASSVGPGSAEL
jgi:hypothetical protein